MRYVGTIKDVLRTNLWLRVADRVKIVVGEFDATTFDDLFEQTRALNWEEILPLNAHFPVEGKSHRSTLHNVPSVQAIVKKAIVKKLQETYHRRGDLAEDGATYPLEVSIVKDHVMLTLDTSGEGLFKRGYRKAKGGAPLKENFAAALVMLAHWFTDNPFVDPVCGSGTIPIEAALIGHNIAPGINRDFIATSWENLTPKGMLDDLKDEADSLADYDVELDIRGYDIDQNMVAIAQENCQAAGLTHDVTFKQLAVQDWHTDQINGVIVANPPYGERLSDRDSVRELYRQMGNLYRPLTTWSKYILTADLEFERYYGQKATKKRKLYNGALRCDLFQYWGKKIR